MAVHNAQAFAAALRLAEQLQHALTSRSIIDQAIGIMRGRTGATGTEAMDRLRGNSEGEETTVVDVATRIVEEATAREYVTNSKTQEGPLSQ